MRNSFKSKTKAFENSIETMQSDLQRLADKGNVSDAFISKQNRLLKHLIAYYNEAQPLVISLKNQLIETQKANTRHREKLTNRIIQFESICILHGILDFPRFLSLSKEILIDWATELHKDEKGFMLTDGMKTFIKELPEADRTIVETILFKRTNKRIAMLLHQLNTSRKKYGIKE